MLERALRKNTARVTFVLPAGTPPAEVSVVGDFNDWRPGVHPLTPRKDGNRAVTVELPTGRSHSFRYLAADDYWFNDDTADDQDGPNSLIHT
ncbi:isoamylase early set domain-containing protein [Streptomyces sp. NRRL F-2580]|uniref:isoamylase early set domain-containing protein n=1 Tax=Streptomyces sp. NRRL F-2580 TaxID=1463841 RepID=UPI0004C82928|nr:isoamylase early set domain-containing protein [Streptomyces sp. NRRL F-2580]